jgi:hypothetical protein
MKFYERKQQSVVSRRRFAHRLLKHVILALLVIGGALLVGILGYMGLAGMNFVDAFLNASMILSGMGPVDELKNDAAKLFAGVYAIASGLLFLGVAGLLLAPVFHRLLHTFHADDH